MSGADRSEAEVLDDGKEPEVDRAEEQHSGDSPNPEGEGVDGNFEDQTAEKVEEGLHRVRGGGSIEYFLARCFARPIAAITIAKRVCSGPTSETPEQPRPSPHAGRTAPAVFGVARGKRWRMRR